MDNEIMISFVDFQKLDLRVGTILEAAPVEGADTLLQLSVNLGEETPRMLVAGIAQHYMPNDLVGRQIVVLANLEPKELMGVTSQGMLLAADVDGKPVLLEPDSDVSPGSRVS